MDIWLIAAIAVLSVNLHLGVSAIAPVLPAIRQDTGLSAATAGLLAAIPLLCYGALASLAPRLARRFNAERVIGAALVVLTAGTPAALCAESCRAVLRSGPHGSVGDLRQRGWPCPVTTERSWNGERLRCRHVLRDHSVFREWSQPRPAVCGGIVCGLVGRRVHRAPVGTAG